MWEACLAPARQPPRSETTDRSPATLPPPAPSPPGPAWVLQAPPPRNLTRLLLAQPVDLQQNLQSPLIRDRDPSPFSFSIAVCCLLAACRCSLSWPPGSPFIPPFVLSAPRPSFVCAEHPVPPPRNPRPQHRFAGASRLASEYRPLHSSSAPAFPSTRRNSILWVSPSHPIPSHPIRLHSALRTFEIAPWSAARDNLALRGSRGRIQARLCCEVSGEPR